MRTAWLWSFLAVAAAPATANALDLCQIVDHCHVPARYASGPFVAKPVVKVVSYRSLQAWCTNPGEALRSEEGALGCSEVSETQCTVYLAREVKDISPELFEMTRQHELAHCRGWHHHD